MKALLTAGGRATRLRPLTWSMNKHLIPLAGKPMLEHAIEKIVAAGITDIVINTNVGDTEIAAAFGDGSRFGAKITYFEQPGGPQGIAHVVKCAEEYLGSDEPFLFYLGDNVILGSLNRFVERFEAEKPDAMLALAKVQHPERFGVPILENGKIIRVLEKPKDPPCNFAVTGIYFCSPKVFTAVKSIPRSPRGEYELPDAFSWLLEQGGTVTYEEITGWWKDTGTPEDLLEGSALLLNERNMHEWVVQGEVRSGAVIRGKVSIGKGTVIGPEAVIRGPVTIGESCRLDNCYIGPHTTIGNFCAIRNADVERSIVFDGVQVSDVQIIDSLLGKNAVVSKEPSLVPKGSRMIVGENTRVEI